ncbi:MAG: GlsB/YeaQ/YmgE family stress response membrane protein [Candidatus Eisenbacteria bacterium]|nr:GlsB/YeaQ/YmgE family stress response membrane protein [Candidatus Eisenbacteria bacterium]
MGILAWIVFGALAGWVASLITGRRQGCCLNIIVGIVGAFLGGLIVELATGRGVHFGFNFSSFIVAIMGAIVLLAIVGVATRPRF